MRRIAVLAVVASLLSGCASIHDTGQGVLAGGLIGLGVGAGAAAIAGGSIAAGVAAGSLVGVVAGAYIGCHADHSCKPVSPNS
jgi:hypothetical protein